MDEAVDITFELTRLGSRDFRWVAEPPRALLRPLEATSLVPRPLRSALEATRSHREALLSRLKAAGKPPRASWSRWESSPRGLQAREYSRKLEKTEVGATWASRASGASRWLLPEPLEPRDGCCLEEAVEETVEEASKLFEDA